MSVRQEDQIALDRSLSDAYKIVRRLSRCSDSRSYDAAMNLVKELRKLGAKTND